MRAHQQTSRTALETADGGMVQSTVVVVVVKAG
jgi:hypothetical protein